MTYHWICNKINTMGATSRAETVYPSVAPEFTPVLTGVRVTVDLVLCVFFVDRCLSFCTFLLAIVLSVPLRFTDSDYSFSVCTLLMVFNTNI